VQNRHCTQNARSGDSGRKISEVILAEIEPARIWGKIVAVFDSYSIRAKLILFLARLESGTRGAEMIDIDDLLAGLIIEDQNEIPSALGTLGPGELMVLPKHEPFLPSETSTRLLESIHQSQPRSQSIPHSRDMPLSSSLRETLAAANDLARELQSKEVTPLHLLAALIRGSHWRVQPLRDVAITENEVIKAIRTEDRG
jgi:hypothetical protein